MTEQLQAALEILHRAQNPFPPGSAEQRMDWISIKEKLPPERAIVMTKIDDGKGVRNEALLARSGIQMAQNKGGDSVDAQKGLRRYAALRLENENRLERLARLRAEAELPAQREADGSAHTGSSGERMARAVERYVEYEQQIWPIIEANQREMDAVRAAVEMLTDPMEREVLRLRYLDTNGCRLMRWRDVAFALYGDDEEKYILAARRIHDKAIMNMRFV